MIYRGWQSVNRGNQPRKLNLTILVEHMQVEGPVEESKGHGVVAAFTDFPLSQPGGMRNIIRMLLVFPEKKKKKNRN